MNFALWTILILIAGFVAVSLGWRWASRVKSFPCPSWASWLLEGSFVEKFNGTQTTVERLELKPGETVLELGPGPGRLLVPAAKQVLPDGKAIGIDIQPGMIERLNKKVDREGLSNVTVILGDAAEPHLPEASVDVVFLCTVLREIPDRAAALDQCYRVLRPGGRLSITELAGDPHYQSRSKVRRLAEAAGFDPVAVHGHWWFFTANFAKATARHD